MACDTERVQKNFGPDFCGKVTCNRCFETVNVEPRLIKTEDGYLISREAIKSAPIVEEVIEESEEEPEAEYFDEPADDWEDDYDDRVESADEIIDESVIEQPAPEPPPVIEDIEITFDMLMERSTEFTEPETKYIGEYNNQEFVHEYIQTQDKVLKMQQ